MTLAEATARQACEDLMIRSYRLVDDGMAGSVTDLFTEEGRFTVTGSVEITGKASLARFFSARAADEGRKTRHCLANLSFSSISADEAAIRATLLVFVFGGSDATTPNALADVEDRYTRQGDGWRINTRTTTVVAGGA